MLGQLLLLWAAAAAAGDAKPVRVTLEDVPKYVGRTINVTFVVYSVRNSKEALLVLNSRSNPGSPENLAVLLLREDSREFHETRWDDLPTSVTRFKNQRINVTGKVRRRDGRYELIVRKRAHLASAGNPT